MTAKDILTIITADEDHVYGLRADRPGLLIGHHFDNSRQWYQDYIWDPYPDDIYSDPDHPFDEVMRCWDDGELDGVCTLGVSPEMTEAQINQLLEDVKAYKMNKTSSIYLVSGSYADNGNDIGEWILHDGVCTAVVLEGAPA